MNVNYRQYVLFLIINLVLLNGCANYAAKSGMMGGYEDKQISSTSYYIYYDYPAFSLSSNSEINGFWKKRAEELCGSTDYYFETKPVTNDGGRHVEGIGGIAYCNNRIIDTREQLADEQFAAFENLPQEVLHFNDLSPLWQLLTQGQFDQLQSEMTALYTSFQTQETSEQAIIGILNTFARVDLSAVDKLTQWIKHSPDSFLAYYSRAVYYMNYAWYKRSGKTSKYLTREQLDGFRKYQKLALADIDRALKHNAKFCPAYRLKLLLETAAKKITDQAFEGMFKSALQHCEDSLAVHAAYVRYLLPRWHGSKEKMRKFIDDSIVRQTRLAPLEALYVAEEGDQFLFAGKFEQALEKYKIAADAGNFPLIHEQKGYALEKLGKFIEAVEEYNIAISISPYNDSAYEGLMRVLLKQNNVVGALMASTYLLAMNNRNISYHEVRGDIFYQMRRYQDALHSYKKASELSISRAGHLHKIRMTEFQIKVRESQDQAAPQEAAI